MNEIKIAKDLTKIYNTPNASYKDLRGKVVYSLKGLQMMLAAGWTHNAINLKFDLGMLTPLASIYWAVYRVAGEQEAEIVIREKMWNQINSRRKK